MSSITFDGAKPAVVPAAACSPTDRGRYRLLSIAVFALVNTPIGITTSLAQVSAAWRLPFWVPRPWPRMPTGRPIPLKLDYGTLFLVGTLLGGFHLGVPAGQFPAGTGSRRLGGAFRPSPMKRYVGAFRAASSPCMARAWPMAAPRQGISGGLQLALSGWVFMAAMFAGGLATAFIMFGRR